MSARRLPLWGAAAASLVPQRSRIAPALVLALALVGVGACGTAGDAAPPTLFGPERTATPVPTATLSADRQEQLLDEGVARTDLGFFVRPPSGWRIDASGGGEVGVRFANAAADQDAHGRAFANLLVGSQAGAVPAPEQRAGYLELTVRDAPTTLANEFTAFELIRSEVQQVGANPMAVVEFTYQDAAGVPLHAIRALAPARGHVFVIAATALASAWPAYAQVFQASLASFTLLGE